MLDRTPACPVSDSQEGVTTMRQRKSLGLTLIALFVSALILVTSASATLPQILPESVVERTWTGKAIGETELTILGSANFINCKAATAEGTEEAKTPLGLFHMKIEKCKSNN